jgi:phosphohistidine swiveling domain-containing protein
MKPSYVLTLSDPLADLETVGGKGMSLAKMANAGLPIPGGFHITTDAYRTFVSNNDLQMKILAALKDVDTALPASLETASATISRLFADASIPNDINNAIRAAYETLRPKTEDGGPSATVFGLPSMVSVAVRSSATAEDLPEASFAGQQETYLNIHGEEAFLKAVKKCWASLWTARAIAYRIKNNIDQNTVALAVVIQEMVNAEAAGILFTANPMNGHRDEMVINAAWGLGEAIVGELVSPDTIIVDKATGKVKQMDIAEKTVITVETENGTEEKPLNDARRNSQVMKEAQVIELVTIARRIESFYGKPQDIEWCRTNGQFYIVQSRPITALPEPPLDWTLPNPKAVMARGSFAEFVPEPISPLFATLAVPLAWDSTERLMKNFGVTEKGSYQFAVINSYLYVGMVITPRMTWQMTKASFALIKPILKTAWKKSVAAREKFLGVVEKWRAQELNKLSSPELLAGTREIFSATAEFYNMAQSATIPTSLTSEALFGMFYRALVKRKDDPEAPTFLFGSENNALRSEKALFDLTTWAKGQPELADYLTRTPADVISAALQTDRLPVSVLREFAPRFNIYLREFGHAVYDLDFAKPVPADDSAPLIETMKVYLSGKNNPHERQRLALERREQAADAIAKRLDPLRRKYFLKLLNWAQETAPLRENSIADMGLGHPQIRRMLRELGKRLAVGGAIACAEDVYWLEASEADMLATCLEKREALKNFTAEVENHKAKWQAMRHIIPPNTLPQKTWMSKFYADNEQKGNTIKGLGASAGKVTARACIMLGPEDFNKMQSGDVIVAGITTPAWTPLFARASAIVTDIGGPLSHSSIVAREYGIPAVLATGVGTRRIRDGQTITVDGSAGTVILGSTPKDE